MSEKEKKEFNPDVSELNCDPATILTKIACDEFDEKTQKAYLRQIAKAFPEWIKNSFDNGFSSCVNITMQEDKIDRDEIDDLSERYYDIFCNMFDNKQSKQEILEKQKNAEFDSFVKNVLKTIDDYTTKNPEFKISIQIENNEMPIKVSYKM